MRFSTLAIALAAAKAALGSQCAADACASAVTGTLIPIPLIERTADCASFIAHTTTPPPTSTIVSSTAAGVEWGVYDPNAVTAINTIPSYAGACADPAAYSSACSCGGVSITTVVAPIPTIILYEDLPNCENPGLYAEGYVGGLCGADTGVCLPDSGGTGWCLSSGDCVQTCSFNKQCLSGICLTQAACAVGAALVMILRLRRLLLAFRNKKQKKKKRSPGLGAPILPPGVLASLQAQVTSPAK